MGLNPFTHSGRGSKTIGALELEFHGDKSSSSSPSCPDGAGCRNGQRHFGSLFTLDFQVPGELCPEAIKSSDRPERERKAGGRKKRLFEK